MTGSCKWGRHGNHKSYFHFKKWCLMRMKIFCNLKLIIHNITFLWEGWIQREKNWACCTSFCSFWNKTSDNRFSIRTTENVEAGLWKSFTENQNLWPAMNLTSKKRMDDILQWPHIDTEIIFAYILTVT